MRKNPSNRCALLIGALLASVTAQAQTALSDIPLYSASNVPANLMLALSVEFPTGTVAAYTDATGYAAKNVYLGYFDPGKCYKYDTGNKYFSPSTSSVAGDCIGDWSGNMLNWASMTALDEFRQALTGGNRVIDTPTLTVLQRSRISAQGSGSNFPTKQIGAAVNVAAATVVPAAYATSGNVYIRTHNAANEFTQPTGSGGVDKGVFIQVSNNSNFSQAGTDPKTGVRNIMDQLYVNIEVCNATRGLESNCKAYGGNYKPEGLIQQNANRIRVGAAGYLFVNGNTHPNGVLRALLRDNGPTTYNGFGTRQPNANAEWDGSTGVFAANPDPAAASASGVSQSGAINYLNKFGYASPTVGQAYETNDTISELYWAALSYYKQVPLDPSYTQNLSANPNWYDGFPVLGSTSNDPIKYSCQGNAIVTIGDSHTWCDTRIPGSGVDASGTGSCTNQQPLAALPKNGTDPGLSASAYATALGKLPLIESAPTNTMQSYVGSALGTTFEPNTPPGASYGMAGMAYYAHTQDIRADDKANPATLDKQTVDTFTVDVMEPGSYDGTSGHDTYDPGNLKNGAGPNMYWLAAKYGGFDDVNDDGVPKSILTWHTNTTTAAAKNLRPDNYFPGNRPDLIQSGLAQVFNRVSSKKILAASGPGVAVTRTLSSVSPGDGIFNPPAAGFPVYTTKYRPGDWTGDVSGFVATGVAGGNVTPVSTPWSAQSQLDTLSQTPNTSAVLGWNAGRRIITSNGTTGVPFRFSNLSAAQQAALNNDTSLFNFLRGDRSNEGTKFHARRHILGDIVGSEAVLVQGALSPHYTDQANPGYSTFAASIKNRQPLVYVGANDGMLHAFAADFTAPTTANPVAGGGGELFAYVPSFVFSGPNNTPQVDGLAALANLNGVTANNYAHHFYVDQTPQVADADFGWTGSSTAGTPDWHTLLVGALGKGGKGIYALDITSVPKPLDLTSGASEESAIKGKVLWEFTAADMGYSYGRPLVVKTRRYGWVVLVTSGYDNATGQGHLYVLNAKTGALLATMDTSDSVASKTNPSGLGRASAFTRDIHDNTVEQVYAGDLHGNVWRFDLSGTGAYATGATLLATLTDGAKAQPITTAPRIELDYDSTGLGLRRWVFVGTGKFLDTTDLTDTQQQSMYALRDGSDVAPATSAPTITRTDLKTTDLTTALALKDTDAGWYYDLPGKSSGGATERIVIDPDAAAGYFQISWGSLIPTSDPCAYQGAIYSASFSSGQSGLVSASGATLTSITTDTAVTKVETVLLPATGDVVLLYGETGLAIGTAKMKPPPNTTAIGRANWREVLD